MIPESIVDEVRERADLVEVVGAVVPLKRSGREFKALCPFHQEKTPSFYVVPDKGFYKCFGCGAAGDVFDFLMQQGGLSFPEAVRRMADRVGVAVPDATPERQDDPYRRLYEAVAFAADWYERQLHESDAGDRARRYLQKRGIDAAAAKKYRLGYAPGGGQAIRAAAKQHGIDDELLLTVGLIKESERDDDREPYDRLRNRVVFPITDARGRVIGFGGRVLDDNDKPKYLNSPETPIYQKGRTLYGLAWSKHAIRREGAALVVEGYMDYVSLAARGVEHVIAPLGTAMTEEQAALVSRYARRALLLYDSDQAGLRATFKTADALLRAGVHPLVVSLPEGEDPDSVAREQGVDGLAKYLKEAQDVVERKLALLDEKGYFEGIDGTRRALDGLLPTIRATMDPQLRDLYVDRVMRKTGVRRETLERELRDRQQRVARAAPDERREGPVQQSAAGPGAPRAADTAEDGGSRGQPPAPSATSERLLLLVLLRDASRIDTVRPELAPEALRDPVYREIYRLILEQGIDESTIGRLSEPARRRLEAMRLDPVDLSPADRVLAEALVAIQVEDLNARIEELDERLAFARDEEQPQLLREKTVLMGQARSLGIRWRETARWKDRAGQNTTPKGARR
ncbi:MAG TPA: DNA primase [Longimicrobiales bacterium]